nr:hypothetical protein Iba_chr01dCG10360 [Ipomoea batatas]
MWFLIVDRIWTYPMCLCCTMLMSQRHGALMDAGLLIKFSSLSQMLRISGQLYDV